MSSPIGSKIKKRKVMYTYTEDTAFEANGGQVLDLGKIQNSGALSSSVSMMISMANGQQEAINKELNDQHENTKDFAAFQAKMQALVQQSLQREAAFQQSIEQSANKIQKTNGKMAALEHEMNAKNAQLSQIEGIIKSTNDSISQSKAQYQEQVSYKEGTFSKTLGNKDRLIADLQSQITKAEQQYEKAKSLRISTENDLKEKEQVNVKLQDRIEHVKRLIEKKKGDPALKDKIQALQDSLAKAQAQLKSQNDSLKKQQQELLALKDEAVQLEKKKLEYEHKIDELKNDAEDREYLLARIKETQASVDQLKGQKNNISQKIEKKTSKTQGQLQDTSEELSQIVNLVHDLNQYERTSNLLADDLRDLENRLNYLIENSATVLGQHVSNKDKLLHTLGKQKGSTTGGLGFLIKHALIERKIGEWRTGVIQVNSGKDILKGKLEGMIEIVKGKNFEQISQSELDEGIKINQEVAREIEKLKIAVDEAERNYKNHRSEFETHQERLRKCYIQEAIERFRISNGEIDECCSKLATVLDSLKSFEQDYDKRQKMIQSKERCQELTRLHVLATKIKDDINESKSNNNNRRSTLEKLKKNDKEIEKLSLSKLSELISSLKGLESQIEGDKKDGYDVEQRVKDLHILFRDLIKQVIKEIHNELQAKASQRLKQGQQLQKKDQQLLGLIQDKNNQILGIRSQLDDSDKDLLASFATQQSKLHETSSDEEKAAASLRSIVSTIDRLNKQAQRVSRDNFDLEEATTLLKQLDDMETNISQTNQALDQILSDIEHSGTQIDDLDKHIKNERVSQCEQTQRLSFACLEQLKRLLERIKSQLNVIEKEQEYLVDEFSDMEKKKEGLSFKQEVDRKTKEWKTLMLTKDKLKQQLSNLEAVFDQRQRDRDTVSGSEFLRIRKENERIKDEIQKQVDLVNGVFTEEIQVCKEIIDKIVKKYKTKKGKYNDCCELRGVRDCELVEWKNKLMTQRDRIAILEGQLSILGVNEDHDAIELYKKFLFDVERLRVNANLLEKQIQKFKERLSEEGEELDLMEIKIVKTAKLEDIYKIFEQLGIQIEGYEKEVEKFDQLHKQIEQEVEVFMNKIRSQQLLDCEQKINEVQEAITQLIQKLAEVDSDISEFKGNLTNDSNQSLLGSQISNKDQLQLKTEDFTKRVDNSSNQRDVIKRQLQHLKSTLGDLDRKSISINEINALVQEAQTIGGQVNTEIKKVNEVQEELRDLNLQWKEKSKAQEERQGKVIRARQLLKSNGDLLEKMRVLLATAQESVGQYDSLYKAMLGSDDYTNKKSMIEKKMRRMAQLRSDCGKLADDEFDIQTIFARHYQVDLDKVTDLLEIAAIIKEGEKINGLLVQDVEEIEIMCKGFLKRRVKIADADIRQITQMRRQELNTVDELYREEHKTMQELENLFNEKQNDQTNKLSKDKELEVRQALEHLRSQFLQFKSEYSEVDEEIRNLSADVNNKDLANEQSFSKLIRYIEILRVLRVKIQALTQIMDQIRVELARRGTLMSSIDSENNLKQLMDDIHKEQNDFQGIKDEISMVTEVCKNYDGYTSGNDDEEFYQVLLVDGQEQLQDLTDQAKYYQGLESEIQQLATQITQQKKNQGGNLTNEQLEDLNDKILKFSMRVQKVSKQVRVVGTHASQNVERLSNHDLENKLDRRSFELQELQKILNEITKDSEGIRDQIMEEVYQCQDDEFYVSYVKKLKDLLTQIDAIVKSTAQIMDEKEDLQKFQWQLVERISSDRYARIELFRQNLILKKRIQYCLKQLSSTHTTIKEVFRSANSVLSGRPIKKVQAPPEEKKIIYKATPGDEVDKIFGESLNRLGINIFIQKLGGGYYMFGTKKIFCKIINGKLVVRVGGGYMGIEDFILQYGQAEAEKYNLLNMRTAIQNDNSAKNAVVNKVMTSVKQSKTLPKGAGSPTSKSSMGSIDDFSSSKFSKDSPSGSDSQSFLSKAQQKTTFGALVDQAKKGKEEVKKGEASTKQTTFTVSKATTKK